MAEVRETLEVGGTPVTAALSEDGAALVLELTDAAGASLLRLRMTAGTAADPDVPWMVPWTVEAGQGAALGPGRALLPTDPPLGAALAGLPATAEVEATGFGVDVHLLEGKDLAADISAERMPDGDLHLTVDPGDLVVCD